MGRNLTGMKRGWNYDYARNTLDVMVDGVATTKIAGVGSDLNIYATGTTKLYPLGTRLEVDDRVFRYCRAGSVLVRYVASCNDDQWSVTNEEPNSLAAIGATTISVVNTTATADLYEGGWAVIFSSPMQVRRITGNAASDGTDCNLYLDGALDAAIVADTTWVTAYPNIYYDVTGPPNTSGNVDYISFVAVPVCTVASGSYFWGQTWGPCYGVASSTVPGGTAKQREVFFSTAGNIMAETDQTDGMQYAGYLLPRTASGSGDQFYMLQLAP